MATSIDSPTVRPNLPVFWGTQFRVAAVLTVWLALIILLGAAGAFVTPAGTPPLPIAIGFGAPLLAFFTAFWLSRSFRDFVMALDLSLISGIQGWRFVGFGFLALYAHNVLPGGFAWRAGLGDVAIGLTAPWVAAALSRRPRFAASTAFTAWNALGILDLVVAIATGAFSSLLASGAAGEITMQPMAQLPLVLIPAYLVPIFFMLHAASLFQARRAARDAMNWN
jgi:hypothetical protein